MTDYSDGGTQIRLYQGAELLEYNAVNGAGRWEISSRNDVNINDGSPADSGDFATMSAPSGMTADAAYIDYTIIGQTRSGKAFSLVKRQSFTKSKAGGSATSVRVRANKQIFTFDPDGNADPSSQTITLTATLQNLSGSASWSTSPSVSLGGSGNTRTLTAASFGSRDSVTITASGGGQSDSVTVYRVQESADGVDGLVTFLTNEAHTVPTDANGNNGVYTNSGTDIEVWEGSTQLDYDGIGASPGHWRVSVSDTNITAGSILQVGNVARMVNVSNITSDTAVITFTITGERLDGTVFSFIRRMTFSRSRSGSSGDRGPGRWNIGVSSLPSQSLADNRWNDGSGNQPARPVVGDQAWFYTGTESSPTGQRVFVCTSVSSDTVHGWEEQTEVIDGNLLVSDTVSASAIRIDGVTLDTDGDELIIKAKGVTTNQLANNSVSAPLKTDLGVEAGPHNLTQEFLRVNPSQDEIDNANQVILTATLLFTYTAGFTGTWGWSFTRGVSRNVILSDSANDPIRSLTLTAVYGNPQSTGDDRYEFRVSLPSGMTCTGYFYVTILQA